MSRESNHREAVYHVERQVLYTALHRPSALAQMALLGHHFGNESHGQLWDLIQSLDTGGVPVDPVSVADVAERSGNRRLQELAMAIGCAADLYPAGEPRYPAGILLQAWRDREALNIAEALRDGASTRQEALWTWQSSG